MSRWPKVWLIVMAIGLSPVSFADPSGPTETVQELGPVRVGQPLPTFGGWGFVPGGGPQDRYSLREALQPRTGPQAKAVVVSFFATWCTPCEEGLPVIDRVLVEGQEQPYRGLLIAIGEPRERVEPFLLGLDVHQPALVDRHMTMARRLGVSNQIPRTFVVDGEGIVRAIFVTEGADFERQLKGVLAEISEGS